MNHQIIVVGGGHAGIEAACAAARMGLHTLLITHNIESIGQMSCNPAIGGIGKGHLVREIDALGGVMAHAADRAGIQFRILNSSKGPAVRATRVQADRRLYKQEILKIIQNHEHLELLQSPVTALILQGDRVVGVRCEHQIECYAEAVVLTVGTFLDGLIHVGLHHFPGGRAGDPPSVQLAEQLHELPLHARRLKTGTPPRLDARSVDFSQMIEQRGDEPAPIFSFMGTREEHPRQVSCFITQTNERTHDIIRSYIDQAPMYAGVIKSKGPRYCPSIEDKIMRFADKTSHHVFIEPESLDSYELYPNGISTSLPFVAQERYVHSIRGLEHARITRAGYAIEYDFFDPQDLHYSLESKVLHNLYLAGQINGTTGYEEAAAQGLLAGINAALRVQEREAWYPRRDQAYLGVLIDDLITKGTHEPYRMFTSRAEHRLLLREDNADQRLTEIGYRLGSADRVRYEHFCRKMERIEREHQRLKNLLIRPEALHPADLQSLGIDLNHETHADELLRRPEVNYRDLQKLDVFQNDEAEALSDEEIEQIDIQIRYAGYITRQEEEILRMKAREQQSLPDGINYNEIPGLSSEIAEKLSHIRPNTLASAARIPGVTPAAINVLLIYLKKHGIRPLSEPFPT